MRLLGIPFIVRVVLATLVLAVIMRGVIGVITSRDGRVSAQSAGRSLLSGKLQEEGDFTRTCSLGTDNKPQLTLKRRWESPKKFGGCCIEFAQPVAVRAGNILRATLHLPDRDNLHVKAELTGEGAPQIYLQAKDKSGKGKQSFETVVTSADLRGGDSDMLAKFCVMAVNKGPLHTITLLDARLAP